MIFGLTQICYILMHVLNNVMGFSTCAKLEACNFTKRIIIIIIIIIIIMAIQTSGCPE